MENSTGLTSSIMGLKKFNRYRELYTADLKIYN